MQPAWLMPDKLAAGIRAAAISDWPAFDADSLFSGRFRVQTLGRDRSTKEHQMTNRRRSDHMRPDSTEHQCQSK